MIGKELEMSTPVLGVLMAYKYCNVAKNIKSVYSSVPATNELQVVVSCYLAIETNMYLFKK